MIKTAFKSRRIFCAPPNYYNVVKGDNAHQREGYDKFQANPERNRERLITAWQKVANELTRLGHELITPELDPEAPDQVFAADSVFHFIDEQGQRAILLSHMNSPTRQREVAVAERLFRKLGYVVYSADKTHKHEGTGDGEFAQDTHTILHGCGPRSDREAGQHVANVTGKTVFALPLTSVLIDDKYCGEGGGLRSKDVEGFHLDVLAQPLPTGHVICYWEGLPHATQQFLSLSYEGYDGIKEHKFYSNILKISKEDYEKFATNCVAVPDRDARNGYTLFIPEDISPELKNILSGFGYRLFEVDIEVARWSGGGLHCMFNVENDFSTPPTRKLNYVEQFMINEWTNPRSDNPEWDSGKRRVVPGLRVFRPTKPIKGSEPINDGPSLV